MRKLERHGEWVSMLTAEAKAAIGAACERVIAETLKPRFLPAIRPNELNYAIDIVGHWRGSKYSFVARFRSAYPETAGEEFDAPFARLDHVGGPLGDPRFDVMWYRHTGKWWRLHSSVTPEEALRLIASDGVLRPPI